MLQRRFARLTIRSKVTMGVVLPLVLILGAFIAIENYRHRQVIIYSLSLLTSRFGQVIEENLRHQMLKSDFVELQSLLDTIGETKDFRVIYLLDTSGKVIFSPNGTGKNLVLDNQQPDCQPCHQLPTSQRPSSVVVTAEDGQRVFRSMHPIENRPECSGCHDPKNRLIGLLLTDIPMAPLEAPIAAHLRENLVWWGGTILVVVIVVQVVMNRLVLSRIRKLADAIRSFGEGKIPLASANGQADELGQLSTAFNAMADQVISRNSENQALTKSLRLQSAQRGELLKRLITAQEDERKRVARELHDELGQTLGGLTLRMEAIQKIMLKDNRRAAEELENTRGLVKNASEQMYNLIYTLRPSILDDLGLSAALRSFAERLLQEAGIALHYDCYGLEERLPPEIETALYRTFQEALNNIVRHARATEVKLTLANRDGTLEGEISDDGLGFDPDKVAHADGNHGWGLLGMQERIALLGGKLWVDSRPGGGTSIRMTVRL